MRTSTCSSPGIELTGVSPRPEHAGASLGTASFGLPAGSLGDLRSARSISEFALTVMKPALIARTFHTSL